MGYCYCPEAKQVREPCNCTRKFARIFAPYWIIPKLLGR